MKTAREARLENCLRLFADICKLERMTSYELAAQCRFARALLNEPSKEDLPDAPPINSTSYTYPR